MQIDSISFGLLLWEPPPLDLTPRCNPGAPRYSVHRRRNGSVVGEANTELEAVELASLLGVEHVRDRRAPLRSRWCLVADNKLWRPT
jgi:hypothetical protein